MKSERGKHMKYDNYLFDLYGTLVDIHTDEQHSEVWERLAVFYGYYGAKYKAEELEKSYFEIINRQEGVLKGDNHEMLVSFSVSCLQNISEYMMGR